MKCIYAFCDDVLSNLHVESEMFTLYAHVLKSIS